MSTAFTYHCHSQSNGRNTGEGSENILYNLKPMLCLCDGRGLTLPRASVSGGVGFARSRRYGSLRLLVDWFGSNETSGGAHTSLLHSLNLISASPSLCFEVTTCSLRSG